MRRVYFIKPIGMQGPIKIGCSQSPDGRRRTLETWSPFPLEILADIQGDEKLERRFHAKFTEQHQSREWFRWSPELQATIDAVAAGTFDVETLPAPRRLHHGHRTGPKKGTPWSEDRKAQAALRRAERKVEKLTGLVRPPYHDGISHEKYIANPRKYGITREEYSRRLAAWSKDFNARLRNRMEAA